MGGSQQLRRLRIAIRDGATVEDAAREADMDLAEARLHAADDLKNPPPSEAFVLLGHNQPEKVMSDSVSADQLRLFIERIERLEEEKKGISDDIKDVYAEAKSTGFDTKTMREVVKLRKMEKHHRDERDALIETYRAALGMDYSDTPLGSATISRAMEKTVAAVNAGALGPGVTAEIRRPAAETDVVKLAADIHNAGGRMVGDTLVMPMSGLKEAATPVDEAALYPEAVALVREHDKASTSWLQRQLRLGYNSAARLIERMEKEGIVSRPDHVGRREVLSEQIAAE